MGIVSKKIRSMFDIKAEVYYLEMNFDAFLKLTRNHKVTVQELSKFPEVRRDLALLVDSQTTFSQLREIAFATEKKLLKNVTLFDVYEGDKLPAGKKSYALNFVLEDTTKTLVDQVIDKTMANLVREFERRACSCLFTGLRSRRKIWSILPLTVCKRRYSSRFAR